MNRRQKGIAVVIIFMSLYQMGMVGISPVISDVSVAFPNAGELAAQLAATFPSLMMVVSALVTGGITRALGRKRTTVIGAAMVTAAGICGSLFSLNLALLFCWSGLLGLGIGLFVPVVNSLVVDNYDDRLRGKVAGWQATAVNLGGVALSLLAGILAAIRWNNAFWVFLGAAVGLVLCVVCLPRDVRAREKREGPEVRERIRIPLYVWVCAVTTLLFAVIYFAFSTNASLLLAERGYSSTAVSGLAVACFMLGGAISGILFNAIERLLGRYMPVAAFLLLALSYLVIFFTQGLVPLCLAAAVGGASLCFLFPHFLITLGDYVSPASLVFCTSLIISVGPNLGSFLSPLILTNLAGCFDSSVASRFLLGAVLAIVLALVLLLAKPVERAGKRSRGR